jgi:peptidoglycan/LPS O-acetylase OafA/YrhL
MPIAAWRLAFRVSALLALIAGLLLFAGATRTDEYFSWTIDPPQTAAFLGASYWSAAVLFTWASTQRSWRNLRIAVWPELAVAVVLLVATYMHLDKFHDDLFGYFWVSVYAIAAPVLIYLIASTRAVGEGDGSDGRLPMPAALRIALGAQALVFGVYAIGLFVTPSGFDGAWPWALTPLTARAIAAFLLGFALAAAIALRTGGLERFRGAALTYAVLGLLQLAGAALHSSDFTDGAALPLFAAFFASVLAVGVAGSLLGRGAPVAGPGAQDSSSRRALSGS